MWDFSLNSSLVTSFPYVSNNSHKICLRDSPGKRIQSATKIRIILTARSASGTRKNILRHHTHNTVPVKTLLKHLNLRQIHSILISFDVMWHGMHVCEQWWLHLIWEFCSKALHVSNYMAVARGDRTNNWLGNVTSISIHGPVFLVVLLNFMI